ncbi:hypothetical protein ACFQY7_50115 [Actinomadura luteofluorescens]|uniref:hypothetical protein n=1 Tax=Actinomadura luteofluorescens TaxID=46163 RepID=UPI0036372C3F
MDKDDQARVRLAKDGVPADAARKTPRPGRASPSPMPPGPPTPSPRPRRAPRVGPGAGRRRGAR